MHPMLETVDFSVEKLPKDAYKRARDTAVDKLVVLQQRARQEGIGLVVLFEGWNGAGKGSRISDLMYQLDARATSVHVTPNIDAQALRTFAGRKHGVTGMHPMMKQFWEALGERGHITFFDRGWYTVALQRLLHVDRFDSKDEAKTRILEYLEDVETFERQLVADGYVVVKFFVHMTEERQKRRLQKLHDDPRTAWRASEDKMSRIGNYEKAYEFYDRLLEGSSFDFAPWQILNGEDKRRTNIAIAETLVRAIECKLDEAVSRKAGEAAQLCQASCGPQGRIDPSVPEDLVGIVPASAFAAAPRASRFDIVPDYPRIDAIDHAKTLDPEEYSDRLKRAQKRLFDLENEMYLARVPLMIMYEGWDAAGKGGNIKRVARALDARAYTIFPSPAPTAPELAHPHLWRYWTRLPKAGHVGMYDRSWYGRVLVERVEGFASEQQWARAYDEINEFEESMVEWGAILLKFWVDVSPDEQLRRFHERESDPQKQWKITDEDWRNREKYPAYRVAIDDMFRLTSTTFAPWTVLESDDKKYARVKALETIVDALERRLHG